VERVDTEVGKVGELASNGGVSVSDMLIIKHRCRERGG